MGVGISVAISDTRNTVEAYVDGSTLSATGSSGANPYTGRPIAAPTGPVLQPVNVGATIMMNAYNRTGATIGTSSASYDTKLPTTFTVPSATVTPDGGSCS